MTTQQFFGKTIYFLPVSLAILWTHYPAFAGVGSTGGGSANRLTLSPKKQTQSENGAPAKPFLSTLKKKRIQKYVQVSLKADLKIEIESWDEKKIETLSSFLTPDIRGHFLDLFLKNKNKVIADIESSDYFDTEKATQISGRARDAVTVHDLASPIIYDLNNLLSIEGDAKEPLLALFFHEHMRHFEFNDDDYQLGHLMSFARNPILLGALSNREKGFWNTLAKSLMAEAWQQFSSRNLLCPVGNRNDLGVVSCIELDAMPLDSIFDKFPDDAGNAIALLSSACEKVGIEPEFIALKDQLAQKSRWGSLNFGSITDFFQPEKSREISWRF